MRAAPASRAARSAALAFRQGCGAVPAVLLPPVVPVLAATEVSVSVPGVSAAFSAVFSAAACEPGWLAADVSPAGDALLAGAP